MLHVPPFLFMNYKTNMHYVLINLEICGIRSFVGLLFVCVFVCVCCLFVCLFVCLFACSFFYFVRSPSLSYLLVHSRCRGFLFSLDHTHTPQLVGLLWTRDRPVAETST
jgi:ABC-type transport system involved in cytochrome c biogenesis permease component